MNQRWKYNLDITVIAVFLTKLSLFGELDLKFLLRSGFGYMAQHLWRTAAYYERPNIKCDITKSNSNSNSKQEANNKEFKVFCGSYGLEITSRKNDISNNKNFCVMILKA